MQLTVIPLGRAWGTVTLGREQVIPHAHHRGSRWMRDISPDRLPEVIGYRTFDRELLD